MHTDFAESNTKRMRRPNWLVGATISFLTLVVGVVAIEGALRLVGTPPYQWDRRLMFFSEGDVFQNRQWGGFVYRPNSTIRSRTYYITDTQPLQLTKEYEYEIKTNSDGLVQLRDIDPDRPSILLLGDSFTEGQGATPWFYGLETRWANGTVYQVINGGILGTGFESWYGLYRDLSKKARIAKIVIIFISHDWIRPMWQFSDKALACLRSVRRCDGTDNFYGLPDDPGEAAGQIERIARERVDYLDDRRTLTSLVTGSAIFRELLAPAYSVLFPSIRTREKAQFEKSETILADLAKEMGAANILLIHLPQKEELDWGPNRIGRLGREFIRRNGFRFVDGFERCKLSLDDFHRLDGHPNASGYRKIADCIEQSVRAAFRVH